MEDEYLEINEIGNFENIHENKKNKKKKTIGGIYKTIFWIFLIIILYLSYEPFSMYFFEMLKSNPTFYTIYLFFESEIVNSTIKGFLILSILGSLFFLILPSEAIFIYYINFSSYSYFLIVFVILLGTMIGLTFNYFFGRVVGERVLRFLFRQNFEKYKKKVEDWGTYVVFFGNIIPGPIEFLSVFFGGFKFPYKHFIILSFMGRLVKYIILLFAFIFFWDQVIYYYDSFLNLFQF